MLTLLSRLFIPDYENYSSPKVRQAYGILTGSVGIFFNFFLFVLKIVAGMISHSIAITADAFNNLSDAGSSVITLIGFKMSGQEADSDHQSAARSGSRPGVCHKNPQHCAFPSTDHGHSRPARSRLRSRTTDDLPACGGQCPG